ncbi:MAG TPA: hypothetical protein VHC73_15635 [Vitreimonas sp.]|jgi:hypothetical protein|nr:hypothetical protein [Vitreimonas sp.]
MKQLRFATVCAVLCAGSLAPAFAQPAQCSAHLTPLGVVDAAIDEPLSGAPGLEAFSLRLREISDPSCRFQLSFEVGAQSGGLHGDNGELNFRVTRYAAGGGILYDSRQPNAADAASLRSDMRLYLIADPGASPRAGLYNNSIYAVLRAADSATELDRQPLALRASIPAHVQAFLSGASQSNGGYALLDFQQLTRGETGHATLHLRATSDVDISFESENAGALVNESDGDYHVPYQLSADGQPIDLRRGEQVARTPAAVATRDIGLDVQIGDVSQALAGNYHDRVTVTVSAR